LYLESFLREEGLAAEEKPRWADGLPREHRFAFTYLLPAYPICSTLPEKSTTTNGRERNMVKENGRSLPADNAYRRRVDQRGMKNKPP
jgi:hypothetical protein